MREETSREIVEVIRGLGLGGAETLLAQRLVAQKELEGGHRTVLVHNFAPAQDYYEHQIKEAAVDVLPSPSSSALRGAVHGWRMASQIPIGCAVVIHSPAAGIGFKCFRALHPNRFVLAEVVHNSHMRPLYVALGRLLNRFVDLGICVSTDVAQSPMARTFRSTETLLGGINIQSMRQWKENCPQAPAILRNQLGLAADARLIVNVGNLHPRKNQHILVKALAAVDDAHLVIIGDGPLRSELQSLAVALRIDDRVHLLGKVPNAWRYIGVADVIAHPSKYEGFPVVIMEALAIGTPIIAAPFAGLNDIAETTLVRQVPTVTAATFGDALSAHLDTAPTCAEAWPSRLAHDSFWNIDRYANDFSRLLLSIRK